MICKIRYYLLAMATNNTAIEKLRGNENFEDWKFAVMAYFQMKDLWKSIEGTESKEEKNIQARAELIMLVDKCVYPHIRECKNAKEIWDTLNQVFADSGLVRRVSLIQRFCSAKLNNFASVDGYVNDILTSAHKLRSAGLKLDEEWVGSMMLAGLPEEYKPMIMGIQSSGMKITGDSIKLKLLQDVRIQNDENLALNSRQKQKPKGPKCFNCQKFGHIAAKCPNKNTTKKKSNAMIGSFSVSSAGKENWYFDSGASAHMSSNEALFNGNIEPKVAEVTVANNSKMMVKGVGNIDLPTIANRESVELNDVLFVPELCLNLLSVSKIVQKGHEVRFTNNGCKVITKDKEVIATGNHVDGMFQLKTSNHKALAGKAQENQVQMWHKRFGHVNNDILKKMASGAVDGICFEPCNFECVTCYKGKFARYPFYETTNRTTDLLELIHSDVCGPMECPSFAGSQYMLIFVDDFSSKIFVYFLKKKSEVSEKFLEFKNQVENETGKRIKAFRSDNGSEFCNAKMKSIMVQNGIQHQTTVPFTPQQNGKSERMNRSIIEKTRCLLIDSKLPKTFWAEAANTAVYLINRTPCKRQNFLSPYETWYGRKPNLKNLKVFGCKAVVQVPKQKRKKLDPKGKEVIFVGYSQHPNSYRFFDPKTGNVSLSRDAKFLESEFLDDPKRESDIIFYKIDFGCDSVGEEDPNIQEADGQENEDISDQISEDEFKECVDNRSSDDSRTASPKLRRSSRTMKPNPKYAQVSLIECSEEPKNMREALKCVDREHWKKAISDELNALVENGTWEIVDLPPGRNAIDSKWTFKIKRNSNGEIERYKARLVAKGYSQKEGIDYSETFSPVVRYSSIRLLLSLAVRHDLDIDQMDVVTAFLQSELKEEIYMKIPEGCKSDTRKVYRLKKSIYGLKQASRVWNRKLDETLKKIGLTQSKTEPCIYFKTQNGEKTYVAIYVDDILIFSNNQRSKEYIKERLSKCFKMKDLGPAHYILGMKLTRDRENGKLWLNQNSYIEDMLKKFNMDQCNPISTPIDINQKITKNMCPTTEDEINEMKTIPYQEAVGSIMYAAQVTRPDIAYAVGVLSRFNKNYGKAHWQAVKRIFRYLKATSHYALQFSKDGSSQIDGFTDADWAGDVDDRKSTTGYVFKFQNGPISWNSKKQQTTALSTTEAEYMALSTSAQEAMWLKSLLTELDEIHSIEIKCDNKSAICLSHNNTFHARSKHIDIRHHFVRELIEEDQIKIAYIQTRDMVADILTKGLPAPKHIHCCNLLGFKDQSNGGVGNEDCTLNK